VVITIGRAGPDGQSLNSYIRAVGESICGYPGRSIQVTTTKVIVIALFCGACSRHERLEQHGCGPWGTIASGGPAVAMSDSVLLSLVRRDSTTLAKVVDKPHVVEGLIEAWRSEPALFIAATRPDRTVCVSENGGTTNINIFFFYPAGRRQRTQQYKDEELLALVWVHTDRWRLMTWTLWSRN